MKTDLKIAVIGAGVSGLTAAHTLRKLGYGSITIYEEKDRIGGKIRTVQKDGTYYEMGGVFVQEEFETIRGLLSEYGLALTKKKVLQAAICTNGRQVSNFKYVRNKYGAFRTLTAFLKFSRFLSRNKQLSDPAFAGTDPSLYKTFNRFADEHGMQPVAYASAPFLTGMGYGYVNRTPALYQLKLMSRTLGFAVSLELNSTLGLRLPVTYFIEKGYQPFLERVSQGFDVRLDSKVRRIERQQAGDAFRINISSRQGVDVFDRVVISSPPLRTREFLDMSDDESRVFSKAQNLFFHTTLFVGQGLPRGSLLFFPECTDAASPGHPTCVINFHPRNSVYQAYHLHDGSLSVGDLEETLRREIHVLGGRMEEIVSRETFPYLTHFSEADLNHLRPYEALERLQGRKGAYFIGGALNPESAEDTAKYAKRLMQKHF
jgi:hypothetical protein